MVTEQCNIKLLLIIDKLQASPQQYRWVYGDSALLQAISRNEPIVRGIRGRLLGGLVKVSRRLGLVWPLLRLMGILEIIGLLLRQRATTRNGNSQNNNYPERFFVGFGAGKEEVLFKQYCENHSGKVGRLNQIDISSFSVWHRVGIGSGFRALVSALAAARMAITALPAEINPWRADFFTYVGMRIGYFAYMRAWFEILKIKSGTSLDEVAFVTGDIPAFAAVDSGFATCYLQHGMIRLSVVLPSFNRVEALTADEAVFMRHRLPKLHVTQHLSFMCRLELSQLKRGILVASIYGDTEYLSIITPFILWANAMKVPLQVRPHPCENSTFWQGYLAVGQVTIEKCDEDIYQCIARLCPRLVVSWFSTAVFDALECGVIPVTVCTDDDRNVADMVYPLFKRCLRWPDDVDSITRLLNDDEYYATVLFRLREGLSGDGGHVASDSAIHNLAHADGA